MGRGIAAGARERRLTSADSGCGGARLVRGGVGSRGLGVLREVWAEEGGKRRAWGKRRGRAIVEWGCECCRAEIGM